MFRFHMHELVVQLAIGMPLRQFFHNGGLGGYGIDGDDLGPRQGDGGGDGLVSR